MPEFTGSALFVQWKANLTAGTQDLSGDYRSVSWNPSIGMVDATAGSDPFKVYLSTQKDTTVSYSGVYQTGGTAIEAVLLPGQFGTLIVGPEGSVAGKRSYSLPAFAQGAKFQWAFSDVVEVACDFQGSGTATYGTF